MGTGDDPGHPAPQEPESDGDLTSAPQQALDEMRTAVERLRTRLRVAIPPSPPAPSEDGDEDGDDDDGDLDES